MPAQLSGGCMCGQFRYELHEAAKFALHCQCRDCQHITGTGHSVLVGAATTSTTLTGASASYEYKASSGGEMSSHFCPRCGSPLFKTTTRQPALYFFHAGSLDDPSQVKPTRVVWARSSQPWDTMNSTLPIAQ
jgi:hypothetical protein